MGKGGAPATARADAALDGSGGDGDRQRRGEAAACGGANGTLRIVPPPPLRQPLVPPPPRRCPPHTAGRPWGGPPRAARGARGVAAPDADRRHGATGNLGARRRRPPRPLHIATPSYAPHPHGRLRHGRVRRPRVRGEPPPWPPATPARGSQGPSPPVHSYRRGQAPRLPPPPPRRSPPPPPPPRPPSRHLVTRAEGDPRGRARSPAAPHRAIVYGCSGALFSWLIVRCLCT